MSIKNLYNTEAREKIEELAVSIDIGMMATNLSIAPFHVIPMSTKKVDDEGSIWFLSNKNSNHNKNIKADSRACMLYSDPGSMEFLNVYGTAVITDEQAILDSLYGKSDDAWFEGKDDPNLSAIKIMPEEVHYWDTKDGKLVSLLKMGIGAITGNEPDLGEEGSLNI